MTLAWMAYLTIVSALAAAAGLAAERALRMYGRPGRWVWMGTLGLSVGLPALAWVWTRLPVGDVSAGSAGLSLPTLFVGGAGALEAIASVATVPPWTPRLDGLALGLWGAMTMAAVAWVARSALHLRRERRAWSRATLEGQPVWLSENRGPAVVGFLSGAVVLPRWIADLEAEVRHAVLLHEREHLRARDHRLHAVGAAAVLLASWNPLLWWQLRRLRLALECDCDARVLSRGVSPEAYGRSLLRVGARLSRVPWGLAAFAEPKSLLRRRVEAMTEKRSRLRGPKAAAAAVTAAGLLLLACEVPVVRVSAELSSGESKSEPLQDVTVAVARGASSERPTFIPYDVRPLLRNTSEVQVLLQKSYPEPLKRAGSGGAVGLWIYVDENGNVGNVRLRESSGIEKLDDAARRVAARMSFSPALNRDQRTPVWVSQYIVFEVQ